MRRVFLTTICILICIGTSNATSAPRIEFSSVPYTDPGGTPKLDVIKGRVIGAAPSQRIVLYARSGDWYVQPFIEQPFTEINSDSTWSSDTHLGTQYAALLVDLNYIPPNKINALPTRGEGVIAIAITEAAPFFWQTWWFQAFLVLVFFSVLFGLFRMRMNQLAKQANIRFEERLAERMRIAQELHDTLLQGFVSASLQLYVAIEEMPEDAPARPKLLHIRRLMETVIAEGRDAVHDLRSSTPEAVDPGLEFSNVGKDLNIDSRVDFRVIVEGMPKPLRSTVWDESYNIGREAVTNAFRHANAKKIEVELEYSARYFRVLVRDDGRGIEPNILESGRDGHWGLSGMRERAEKVGADLKVRSRSGAGTEVELAIPNQIAFETHGTPRPLAWLTGYPKNGRTYKSKE
jgi:signal transduction histidine kinase